MIQVTLLWMKMTSSKGTGPHQSLAIWKGNLAEDDEHYEGMTMTTIPRAADNVSSTLGSISNTLVEHDLS